MKKCPNSITLDLNLSGCEIDDEILSSNLVGLSGVMSKIHALNFSRNKHISDKVVT